MTIHELKIDPSHLCNLLMGWKTFEIRFNDRDFKVDDVLHLREWRSEKNEYSGHDSLWKVSYILTDEFPGLCEGFVAMSVERVA